MESVITNADVLKLHRATGILTVYLKKNLGMVDIKKVLKAAKHAYETSEAAEKGKTRESWDLLAIKLIEESLTFEEARFLLNYDLVRIGDDSRPWNLARKKCSDFGIPLVEAAETIDEIKNLYQKLPQESEAYQRAIDKWNELTLAGMDNANTVAELTEVLRNSHNPSTALEAVKKKLDGLAAALIDGAKTQAEAQKAYKSASFNSDTAARNFEKVLSFVNSLNSAKEAFCAATLDGSIEQSMAFEKCLEFGSFYGLIGFYSELRQKRNSHHYERRLFEKIEALALENAAAATRVETIKNLYYSFWNNYTDGTKKALVIRWEELALLAANNITSPEGFKEVFYDLPDDSEARRVALQKMLAFC